MAEVLTQPWVEEVSKRFVLNYYWVLVVVWAVAVGALMRYDQPELAAAVLGAGPFILYSLYKGIVDKPHIEADGEVYADKLLLHYEEKTDSQTKGKTYVWPVIEILVSIKNVGKQTARGCHPRVRLNDANFFARWTDELYKEKMDLHPGWSREIILMQLVPTQESLRPIIHELGNTSFVVDRGPFLFLEYGSSTGVSPNSLFGESMHIQRPMEASVERSVYERLETDYQDERRFIGMPISEGPRHNVVVNFSAEDWFGTVDFGQIDIENLLLGIEEKEWQISSSEFQSVVDTMKSCGWLAGLA